MGFAFIIGRFVVGYAARITEPLKIELTLNWKIHDNYWLVLVLREDRIGTLISSA